MKNITFRPRALRDLDEIWDYSVSVWGTDRAERYASVIRRTVETLAARPSIGRSCDEVRPGYRKHPSGSHVVFYRILNDGIDVVRILHERMDHTRHL